MLCNLALFLNSVLIALQFPLYTINRCVRVCVRAYVYT